MEKILKTFAGSGSYFAFSTISTAVGACVWCYATF